MNKRSAVVLLAEDSPNDAEMAREALAAHQFGNEIVHVEDGAEALDYLYRRGRFEGRSGGHPRVVLLDLKMPKVDGLEALRVIKQDPRLRPVPIVILTSSREERDLARGHELGVNAYVVKPVDFTEFVEALGDIGRFWLNRNEPVPDP